MTGKEAYHTNTQDLEWNEERASGDSSRRNIGDIQRATSIVLGGGLLLSGLFKRSWGGIGLSMLGTALIQRGISGYCAGFNALGLSTSHEESSTNQLGRRKVKTKDATKVRQTIDIDLPPAELYRFWRDFENLPRIMSHLASVHIVNESLSHWVVKTISGGPSVEWDAEIINDVEHERIGWRSLHGADVDNAGSVEFEPLDDGQRTRLIVTLQYAPPAGRIGTSLAKWLGEDPEKKIAQDLQRFKESVESSRQAHLAWQ